VPAQSLSVEQAGALSQASSAKQIVEPDLTPPPQKHVVLPPQFWKVPHSPGLVQAVEGVGVTVMVVVWVDGRRVVVVELMLKQEQAEA
jgi:hypothetical protein